MANFVPKSIFRIKNSDGSTSTATEWDFGQIGNGGLEFIPTMIIILLFSIIASPVLCFFAFYLMVTQNSYSNPLNVIGLIIGGYFLIDAYNDWYLSGLTLMWFNVKHVSMIIGLNLGATIVHLIFLLTNKLVNLSNFIRLILILGVFYLFFYIGLKKTSIFAKASFEYVQKLEKK